MEVPVKFSSAFAFQKSEQRNAYICIVEKAMINSKGNNFVGEHEKNKSDNDVNQISFYRCKMNFIPKCLFSTFKNLQYLIIINSDITSLQKDDFPEGTNLHSLYFYSINVQYLPENLFENLQNLRHITFKSCKKLEFINPDILDGLQKLKVARFIQSKGIDACYNPNIERRGTISLAELKKKFRKPPPEYFIHYDVVRDLKSFMNKEEFKDLTINVDGEHFRVHKFIMAARSPVLARLLILEQTELILGNIKKDHFKEVLKYIYDGEFPSISSTNAFEYLYAVHHLGLEKLKIYILNKMIGYVTEENALKMLNCGVQHKNTKLKMLAFNEIMKLFPGRTIKKELADDPEKLGNIIEAKKVMDEKIKKAQEDFELIIESE